MKRLISILVLLITSLCITSCGLLSNNINSRQTYLSVEIFQTLGSGAGLAMTPSYDVIKVVSNNEVYYDGKKLSGTYVLIDTYRYETKDGRIKTVPVYKRKTEL